MSVSLNDKPRVNFGSVKNPLPFPDFLEVQLKSFRDFLQLDTPPENRKNEGLYKVFAENFPIADTRNNFVLEFLDYYIDPPRYTIDECLERGLTYSVPLKAKLKLYCTDPDHEDFDTVIQDVYLGPIPYMTAQGTFVINGAERVVVSQLHRSPGVFFGQSTHANGTKLDSARIIPFRGSWIEFATDINNVMYAYIDRKKKLPVTTLLRAIGLESDKDIIEIFDLAEEIKVNKTNLKKAWNGQLMTGQYRYYDGLVHYLAMLHLCGSFKIYKPAPSVTEITAQNEYNGVKYDSPTDIYDFKDCQLYKVAIEITDVENVKADGVAIVPNPASTKINIIAEEQIKSVEIIDMIGNKVVSTNSSEISVANLPAGVYMAVISTEKAQFIKKVMIKR